MQAIPLQLQKLFEVEQVFDTKMAVRNPFRHAMTPRNREPTSPEIFGLVCLQIDSKQMKQCCDATALDGAHCPDR